MGWNDWSHYPCWIDEGIILDNARALVASGLAARGYDTVTVDDCWMAMSRSTTGDLVADLQKFPHGMKWLGDQLHALGLRFGIYQDAGWKTCGEYPGSGQPEGGGPDHSAQDARLFASWGVDYLKLDGCSVWVPPGQTMEATYRTAYAAQSAALAATGRDIVFSESAPAYFQHGSSWDSVLGWVGHFGQLWRLGEDIQIYDSWDPEPEPVAERHEQLPLHSRPRPLHPARQLERPRLHHRWRPRPHLRRGAEPVHAVGHDVGAAHPQLRSDEGDPVAGGGGHPTG